MDSERKSTIQFKGVVREAKHLAQKYYLDKDNNDICLLYGLVSENCLIEHILKRYNITKEKFEDFLECYVSEVNPLFRGRESYGESIDITVSDICRNFRWMCTVDITRIIGAGIFDPNSDKSYLFQRFLNEFSVIEKNVYDEILDTARYISIRSCNDQKELYEEIDYKRLEDYFKVKDSHFVQVFENTGKFDKIKGFVINMNKMVITQKEEPIVGREQEISNIITILGKKNKSNPIILGEAGVGKTALVEGFVQRIISGDVPESLRDKVVLNLNINSLVSGCKYRGDLEERIEELLDAISNEKEVIVFIDEIHMIVNAGGGKGKENDSNSFSDAIKPALASGKIKVIGATTLNEYRATIEKDGALDRRFQPIFLNEPSEEETFKILSGIKSSFESFHHIKIPDEILRYIISMASKYICERNFPDKAIDVMDEACALTSMKNEHVEYLDKDSVKEVISKWKRLEISEISNDEFKDKKLLKEKLGRVIVGQDEAIDRVVKTLTKSSLGLINQNKPMASFFIVGQTGVGKTLFAKTLAKNLYVSKELIRLDMSEYMEKESVSKIIGSPPGYVGFDSTNGLSEKVRRNMQSVVLIDEIDKAHHDVINLFLQILDEGHLTDSYGRKIDFHQTVIIFTANTSSYYTEKHFMGVNLNNNNSDKVKEDIIRVVKSKIGAEIIDRVNDIIVFNNLTDDNLANIAENEVSNLLDKFKQMNYYIEVESSVYSHFKSMLNSIKSARNIISLISYEISDFVMENIINGKIETHVEYLMSYSKQDASYSLDKKIFFKTRNIRQELGV